MSETLFRYGHATHPDWRMACELVLAQLEGQAKQDVYARRANLGFMYVTPQLAPYVSEMLALLKVRTAVIDWVGTCGLSILATHAEYVDEPALAVLLGDFPPGSISVFSGRERPPAPGERTASGALAAHAALVHADPATPELTELITDMANKTESGWLFGGVASGEVESLPQVANQTFHGGLSGAMFSSQVRMFSRVTQGCAPLAAEHVISACSAHYLETLDGRPALDVMLDDLGVDERAGRSRDGDTILRALPAQRLRRGLLIGLAPADADRRFGFGDYLVRNVVGIDPENRVVAITWLPREGERAVFCTRDARAARQDLIRICSELREEVEAEGIRPRGALYVSCVARGAGLFGHPSAEVELISAQFGEMPMVGFYGNGEIARGQLYGYTGVLTLFV
ncbi:MAG: FIST C-terminal domain-containing protein [Burkholderiales bacterium]|nr:MAG: FIST C-terminal domain-containing protein [Burkholderiales bacterium]